jgi:hypothetical protein
MTMVLIPVGFSIAALLIGRWWVPLVALVTWIGIAIFVVAKEGRAGLDWGEFGIVWDLLVASLTLAGSVIGVTAHRLLRALRESS